MKVGGGKQARVPGVITCDLYYSKSKGVSMVNRREH